MSIMPASNNKGGSCLAFPDVVKACAPPAPFVPVPCPDTAQKSQAKGSTTCKKLKLDGGKALCQGTEISMSAGDEVGTCGGGMVSAKIKGACKCKLGSSVVKGCGKRVTFLGCMWTHNNDNMVGCQIKPSTTKVKVRP